MKRIAVFSILLAAVAVQGAAPAAAGFAGRWRMTAGGQSCVITLGVRPAGKGFALAQKCPDAFPLQSAAAWKPFDGGMVFMSESGVPLVTFQEAESGLYLASNDPGLSLRLDSAQRASALPVDMVGPWSLGPASGAQVCNFLFAKAGGMTMIEPCRPEWRAKNLAAWKLANGELALSDAKGQVQFRYRQRDPNTFTDERELETPLMLWRPVRR